MNVLEEARYRVKNREWEDGAKQRRAREFEAALDRLERLRPLRRSYGRYCPQSLFAGSYSGS